MNKSNYAIRILTHLKMIDGYINEFNGRVEKYALSTHNCYENSVDEASMNQIFKIYEMSRNGNILNEIRNAVVDATNNLEKQQRLLLILFFVKKASRAKILKFFNISERTLYRHLNAAQKSLEQEMTRLGFSEKWFGDLCKELKQNMEKCGMY